MESSDILEELLSYLRISANNLSVEIGLNSNVSIYHIKKGRNKISPKIAKAITDRYKNINYEYLLTGEGDMLNNNSTESKEFTKENSLESSVMFVPLVNQYGYSTYLNRFTDEKYIEELPKIPFLNDREKDEDFLCFEVKGDSMDNETTESYIEGDILFCRNIRQEYWKSKLHINKWKFVIVHKELGVLIKQIVKHDVNQDTLTLHSLNNYYDDIEIHLKDVSKIFNVVEYRRKTR